MYYLFVENITEVHNSQCKFVTEALTCFNKFGDHCGDSAGISIHVHSIKDNEVVKRVVAMWRLQDLLVY